MKSERAPGEWDKRLGSGQRDEPCSFESFRDRVGL